MNNNIRLAIPEEHPALEALMFRSKAYWGHDAAFMEAARPLLVLNIEKIKNNNCFIYEVERKIIGFHSFNLKNNLPELTHLFVEPEYIGKGIGSQLWNHAITFCKNAGFSKFIFEADPDAAKHFYLKKGCQIIRAQTSEINPNRQIPWMEYTLPL